MVAARVAADDVVTAVAVHAVVAAEGDDHVIARGAVEHVRAGCADDRGGKAVAARPVGRTGRGVRLRHRAQADRRVQQPQDHHRGEPRGPGTRESRDSAHVPLLSVAEPPRVPEASRFAPPPRDGFALSWICRLYERARKRVMPVKGDSFRPSSGPNGPSNYPKDGLFSNAVGKDGSRRDGHDKVPDNGEGRGPKAPAPHTARR